MECWFAESFTQHIHLNNMAAVGSLCFYKILISRMSCVGFLSALYTSFLCSGFKLGCLTVRAGDMETSLAWRVGFIFPYSRLSRMYLHNWHQMKVIVLKKKKSLCFQDILVAHIFQHRMFIWLRDISVILVFLRSPLNVTCNLIGCLKISRHLSC